MAWVRALPERLNRVMPSIAWFGGRCGFLGSGSQ